MEYNVVHFISDLLSLITIGSCLILKVPQIMKIKSMKSAKGVNLNGLLLELVSYSTTFLYNYCNSYSLMSYMEYPIILFQEVILIYYVLYYNGYIESLKVKCLSALYFGIVMMFMLNIFPTPILTVLIPFCTPVSASSKVVFLYEILKSKNSDAVSLLTWALSAFTNATRIFTVFVDSADINLLANFSISTGLSSSVLVAAWYYKRKQNIE